MAQHVSILLHPYGNHPTVLSVLKPAPGEHVLDVTLGLGGHAAGFLSKIGDTGTLTGIDADEKNLDIAKQNLAIFDEQTTFVHANFGELPGLGLGTFDIIFADLGLSSPHLDDASRGFTFREDAPLDMRFDRTTGRTAADLLQNATEKELSDIFFLYGEMFQNKSLVKKIKERSEPITTTFGLKKVVEEVFSWKAQSVLPQVFQALRIAVNDEMESLKTLLSFAPTMLNPGGRLGIISFHSLEDRMVKQTFRELTTAPRDETTGQDLHAAPFELLTKKAIAPSDEEIALNSRSRSAKFRAIRKQA